jgi:pimeloyl-ACP methyl ester carboxylesterase
MGTFTTNDGVTLTYSDTGGSGVPLVMVHGWGQTQAMFRNQLSGLASSRRVITYDQRGHGVSEKPHYGYRIARLATDFAQLLDHLDVAEADVLGWSMGVSVLWSYMDMHGTGRVRRFVAVDQPAAVAAVPWMTAAEQAESGALFGVEGLLELGGSIFGPGGEKVTEGFVRGMFSGEPAAEVWDFVAEEVKSTPAYAGVPLLFDHCAQDWRDMLPRVDVPTLVIACDGSHVHPDSQRYIAAKIPGAQLHVFGSDVANSHFPFLENPPAFNAVVDEFLSGA